MAWREEVETVRGKLLDQYPPEDLLDTYPLKPLELLRDRSYRVLKDLKELAKRLPEAAVWLLADDGSVEIFTLEKLVTDNRNDLLNDSTVLLPPSVGGLAEGTLDGASGVADDVADEWREVNGTQRRIRVWDDDPQLSEKINRMRLIRTIDIDPEGGDDLEADETASHRYWHWYELPKVADNDGSERDVGAVLWQVHTDDVVRNASRIVEQLPLSDQLRKAIILAAHFHDLGKRRALFQKIIANPEGVPLLAKSGRKKQLYSLNENYRHEFASLLDIQNKSEFLQLSEDMKEVILHLVAAHHGRGRPHFPAKEAYDPEATDEKNSTFATQVPQRFAKLQRKYGRWGLAYLESLLRAADYAASANPSAFWEGEQ